MTEKTKRRYLRDVWRIKADEPCPSQRVSLTLEGYLNRNNRCARKAFVVTLEDYQMERLAELIHDHMRRRVSQARDRLNEAQGRARRVGAEED